MEVEINWLAVVLASASTMVVGSVWYTPKVFGNAWKRMVNLDEKKMQNGATKAILLTVLVSFLTAYILAHLVFITNVFYHNSFFANAIVTSFWLWLGFVAARLVTHDAFEQRPAKLTIMNLGHELVTLLVMGAIIGWLHP